MLVNAKALIREGSASGRRTLGILRAEMVVEILSGGGDAVVVVVVVE